MEAADLELKVKELEAENRRLKGVEREFVKFREDHAGSEEKLRNEAAEHRIEKTRQKKLNHILKTILERNNISISDKDLRIDGLELENGEVKGEVLYQPKTSFNPGSGEPPVKSGGSTELTMEQIQGMSRDQIRQNWDQVAAALKASGQSPEQRS